MAVYPPLKFIEQVENYFVLSNARNLESVVNNKAIKFVEDFLSTNRNRVFHDYGAVRDLSVWTDDVVKSYNNVYTKFCRQLGIQGGMDSVNDFLDLLIYYDIRNNWRRNKLAYIIDNNLFGTLIDMDTPKLAPIDCITKLPANCFYIDYNGLGDEFMQDLQGTFISADKTGNELNIVLVHLVNSSRLSRTLFVTTVLRLPLNGSDRFIPNTSGLPTELKIECEDGVVRVLSEKKMCSFFYNFLVYLHASNRDVTISERTRKNHDKVVKNIKNKFREVKEFEVGFAYGRSIRKDATRIKYIDEEKIGKPNGVSTRPVSSHYRSAHWHHYWTGSGDDKKLIIKWVEGVFVNGGKDEAEKVVVHKVK